MTAVGYFNWRRTHKHGVLDCEKILAVHRDVLKNSPNHQDQERYKQSLVAEYCLDEEFWTKSLAELSEIYPAPIVPPLQKVEDPSQAFVFRTRIENVGERATVMSGHKREDGQIEFVTEINGYYANFEGSHESIFLGMDDPKLKKGQGAMVVIIPD